MKQRKEKQCEECEGANKGENKMEDKKIIETEAISKKQNNECKADETKNGKTV